MNKLLLMVLGIIMVFGLAACGGNKVDETTTEKYREQAEKVVTLLNEGNYSEIHTMFDEKMTTGLPLEKMNELTPLIEESGTFEKVDKFSVEEKDGFYVSVLVAKYSETKRVYTISFNEDEEVVGLFIK